MSLRRETGIGRLTADPEVKQVTIGNETVAVAEFTVAVDPDFGSKDTDFVRCVAWRGLAETAGNHLSKGRLIYYEGRPKNRSYTAKKDNVEFTQYVTEVILNNFQFLDSPGKEASGNEGASKPASTGRGGSNKRVPF